MLLLRRIRFRLWPGRWTAAEIEDQKRRARIRLERLKDRFE